MFEIILIHVLHFSPHFRLQFSHRILSQKNLKMTTSFVLEHMILASRKLVYLICMF